MTARRVMISGKTMDEQRLSPQAGRVKIEAEVSFEIV